MHNELLLEVSNEILKRGYDTTLLISQNASINDNTLIEYIDLKSIICHDLRMHDWPEYDLQFFATQYKNKKNDFISFPKLISDLRNIKAEAVTGSYVKGDLMFRQAETPPEILSVLKKVYASYEELDIVSQFNQFENGEMTRFMFVTTFMDKSLQLAGIEYNEDSLVEAFEFIDENKTCGTKGAITQKCMLQAMKNWAADHTEMKQELIEMCCHKSPEIKDVFEANPEY